MSGIKKRAGRLVALAALTLSFLAAALAEAAPITAGETAYTTAEVTYGTLTARAQAKASPYNSEWEEIIFNSDYGSTTFVRYLVETGDYVEAGQPVAEIMTSVDEITVKEMELRLERAQGSYEEFLEQYEAQLEAAMNAVKESSGTAKQIAELNQEKQIMELEKSRQTLEEGVAALEKQLEIYRTAMETTQVTAPVSGMVGWLNRYRSGDTIWDGSALGGIYSMEKVLFSVADTTGILRYGMKVELSDSAGNTYQGKIISCNNESLSKDLITAAAYIKTDEEIPLEKMTSLTASYETIQMENVLIVDARAVKMDKNGSYVLELADGILVKRYFTVGRTVNGICYAADGLNDGMIVVIN